MCYTKKRRLVLPTYQHLIQSSTGIGLFRLWISWEVENQAVTPRLDCFRHGASNLLRFSPWQVQEVHDDLAPAQRHLFVDDLVSAQRQSFCQLHLVKQTRYSLYLGSPARLWPLSMETHLWEDQELLSGFSVGQVAHLIRPIHLCTHLIRVKWALSHWLTAHGKFERSNGRWHTSMCSHLRLPSSMWPCWQKIVKKVIAVK